MRGDCYGFQKSAQTGGLGIVFDGPPPAPAPKKKAARRNYKDAYFSLSHDIRMAVCRLEDCLSKSDDGRYLAALLADLDSALEQAERKLLSGD